MITKETKNFKLYLRISKEFYDRQGIIILIFLSHLRFNSLTLTKWTKQGLKNCMV